MAKVVEHGLRPFLPLSQVAGNERRQAAAERSKRGTCVSALLQHDATTAAVALNLDLTDGFPEVNAGRSAVRPERLHPTGVHSSAAFADVVPSELAEQHQLTVGIVTSIVDGQAT